MNEAHTTKIVLSILLLLSCQLLAFRMPGRVDFGALQQRGTSANLRTHAPIQPHRYSADRSTKTRAYGIPKLFRWLIDLYPIVVESVGAGISSSDMKVDNFYLDMNGIIHTCTHSNDDHLIPLQEKEMFLRIFAYTDRLYKLVKPTKLMYLAVDGVAPRAKMNQQRARRFLSAKGREALIADYVAREGQLPEIESFDSNCITPGTEFMYRLGNGPQLND